MMGLLGKFLIQMSQVEVLWNGLLNCPKQQEEQLSE